MGCFGESPGVMRRFLWFIGLAAILPWGVGGCGVLPEPHNRPVVQNPFPQLARVAVAPFFNLTTEASVDSRQFALAYFNELQAVRGFEVVPVGVVEQQMKLHELTLESASEARKLAQILGVDAIVIGAVTDYSPYYPPRCGLRVEWYAANPCFHPIPPGYGLPWGTPDEEEIPEPLIFESEMALARAQLATKTPAYEPQPVEPPKAWPDAERLRPGQPEGEEVAYHRPVESGDEPPAWPDPRDLIPPGPDCPPGECQPSDRPVLLHTRSFNGHDDRFTEALRTYVRFRDDQRFGGWKAYLMRSDDFIRFCCHLHIAEMLTARGGAGESQVVWRLPESR